MSRYFFFSLFFGLMTACVATTLKPVAQGKPSMSSAAAPTALPTKHSVASCQGTSRLLDVMIPSEALGETVSVRLYLPPCNPDDGASFPVIYLLHGASADETQWDDVEVDEAADAGRAQGMLPPLILVFPRRTSDSLSVQPDGDLPFEHFVIAELLPWVEAHTPAQPDRDHRAIGGISRGGFWALEIAFHHPELFSEVGGHSPVVGKRDDLLSPAGLLASHPTALRRLRVWLDVGSEDSLGAGTANLAADLEAAAVPTEFERWPGGHDRAYWRMHTVDYLAFYSATWVDHTGG